MSDEWTEWKKAWDAGARTLPEIQAQADKQRRRMLAGIVGVWLIGGCLVVGSIASAFASPSWVNTVNALFQTTFVTAMITLTHVLMWGNWKEPNETPDAQLGLMERRWLVRRRLGQFVRWGGTFACVFTEAFGLVVALRAPTFSPSYLLGHTAFVGAMVAFFWWATARMDRKIDTAIAELAEQRRLLRESDPGVEGLD
jgi:hypothetical protein